MHGNTQRQRRNHSHGCVAASLWLVSRTPKGKHARLVHLAQLRHWLPRPFHRRRPPAAVLPEKRHTVVAAHAAKSALPDALHSGSWHARNSLPASMASSKLVARLQRARGDSTGMPAGARLLSPSEHAGATGGQPLDDTTPAATGGRLAPTAGRSHTPSRERESF